MRRHSTTGRLPKEHFQTEEATHLRPAPTEPYDIPIWASPKVGRDHFAHVACALYTLPTQYIGRRLRARADSRTVRFYLNRQLIKTHARKQRGGRSVDQNDFPKDKRTYALRDVNFLKEQAAQHGESIGLFAQALLDGPLPWTRMRQVYALLGLVRRFGPERVDPVCGRALAEAMTSVKRLARMLELGAPPPVTPNENLSPLARHLRPKEQYALAGFKQRRTQ
jgi:hypothetical protein